MLADEVEALGTGLLRLKALPPAEVLQRAQESATALHGQVNSRHADRNGSVLQCLATLLRAWQVPCYMGFIRLKRCWPIYEKQLYIIGCLHK